MHEGLRQIKFISWREISGPPGKFAVTCRDKEPTFRDGNGTAGHTMMQARALHTTASNLGIIFHCTVSGFFSFKEIGSILQLSIFNTQNIM